MSLSFFDDGVTRWRSRGLLEPVHRLLQAVSVLQVPVTVLLAGVLLEQGQGGAAARLGEREREHRFGFWDGLVDLRRHDPLVRDNLPDSPWKAASVPPSSTITLRHLPPARRSTSTEVTSPWPPLHQRLISSGVVHARKTRCLGASNSRVIKIWVSAGSVTTAARLPRPSSPSVSISSAAPRRARRSAAARTARSSSPRHRSAEERAPSSATRSFTGRSRPARASRICRRRGSATALNAPPSSLPAPYPNHIPI